MGKEINRIRLNRLYSENNVIEEIIFHDGVNIILGEKYDNSSVKGRKTNGVGKICVAAGVWLGFCGSCWDCHSDFNGKCVIICVGNAFRHLGNLFSVRFAAIVL